MATTEPAPGITWSKSSYSGAEGNACLEVARLPAQVSIRDSKNAPGPVLTVPATTWRTFITFAATCL